jgi:hypothetical protein
MLIGRRIAGVDRLPESLQLVRCGRNPQRIEVQYAGRVAVERITISVWGGRPADGPACISPAWRELPRIDR